MDNNIETVICIPGIWEDQETVRKTFQNLGEGLILVGDSLFDVKNDISYYFEIYNFDKNLWKSFYFAGLDKKEAKEVKKHKTTIYIYAKTGNSKSILYFYEIVSKLLNLGGIAVKIESSGLAITNYTWLNKEDTKEAHSMVDLFVSIIYDRENFYSCGMHNFGYPDIWISTNNKVNIECIIISFLKYLINEKTTIRKGYTFRLNNNTSIYCLGHKQCTVYPKDDLFFNPLGYWEFKIDTTH